MKICWVFLSWTTCTSRKEDISPRPFILSCSPIVFLSLVISCRRPAMNKSKSLYRKLIDKDVCPISLFAFLSAIYISLGGAWSIDESLARLAVRAHLDLPSKRPASHCFIERHLAPHLILHPNNFLTLDHCLAIQSLDPLTPIAVTHLHKSSHIFTVLHLDMNRTVLPIVIRRPHQQVSVYTRETKKGIELRIPLPWRLL